MDGNISIAVVQNIAAKDKKSAINILLEKAMELTQHGTKHPSRDVIYNDIMNRESLQSTGVGEEMAFPHLRVHERIEPVIVLGTSREGIDFHSPDKKPVHLIFFILSSVENPYFILQSMSRIIKKAQKKEFRDLLLNTADAQAVAAMIRECLGNDYSIVRASDLMRPIKTVVDLDMPIEEVVKIMHLKRLDIIPVLGSEGNIEGQISCFDIFDHGIPDFFRQLSSVSFVRQIDPFDKYFSFKKTLKVRDFVNKDIVIISEDETLMEIMFLITVKKAHRIYVAREGKLAGVVDRFSILHKILFF